MLDFAFGSYTILPDPGAGSVVGAQEATAGAVAATGPSSPSRRPTSSASSTSMDDPDHDDAVLTPEAVNLRLQKASLTVRHVLRSPDILGVVEVENLSILQRLAARINADAVAAGGSDPMYVAYLEEGNDIGGIDSGFLVKSARVDVIERRAGRQGHHLHAARPGAGRAAAAAERSAAAGAEGGGARAGRHAVRRSR